MDDDDEQVYDNAYLSFFRSIPFPRMVIKDNNISRRICVYILQKLTKATKFLPAAIARSTFSTNPHASLGT